MVDGLFAIRLSLDVMGTSFWNFLNKRDYFNIYVSIVSEHLLS